MRPVRFGEGRPVQAFGDIDVRSNGDDQRVSLPARFLKMLDVSVVEQIEDAVTEHDFLSGGLHLGNALREQIEVHDLARSL